MYPNALGSLLRPETRQETGTSTGDPPDSALSHFIESGIAPATKSVYLDDKSNNPMPRPA